MPDELKVFNVRLSPELHSVLNDMAKDQKRSLHNMVIVILASAAEQWMKERRESEPGR